MEDPPCPVAGVEPVGDGGQTPEAYYHQVLRMITDPCRSGECLAWVRVLDYYHATHYVSKLAEALFAKSWRAMRWARRMRGVLKEWAVAAVGLVLPQPAKAAAA